MLTGSMAKKSLSMLANIIVDGNDKDCEIIEEMRQKV